MKKKNILLLILGSIFTLNCLISLSFAEQPTDRFTGENAAATETAATALAQAEAEAAKLEKLIVGKAKRKLIVAQIKNAAEAAHDAAQKARTAEHAAEEELTAATEKVKENELAVKEADRVFESTTNTKRLAARKAQNATINYPDDDELVASYDKAYILAEAAAVAAEKRLIAATERLETAEAKWVEAGEKLEDMGMMREKAEKVKAVIAEIQSNFEDELI